MSAAPSPWLVTATGGGDFDRPMIADLGALRRGLEIFADPDAGCEIMALKSGRFEIRPGRDIDGLVECCRRAPSGVGLYVRLNPVSPDQPAGHTTRNGDILRRRWVYVDVDSPRAEGFGKEAATDAEKRTAYHVAQAVRGEAAAAGWPEPMFCDSGNGYALYWRCDLPNDESSRKLIRLMPSTRQCL